MSDYDPRDWGYTLYKKKGFYFKETYHSEYGGNVFQPLVLGAHYFTPEPYVSLSEVKAFLDGAIYQTRVKQGPLH